MFCFKIWRSAYRRIYDRLKLRSLANHLYFRNRGWLWVWVAELSCSFMIVSLLPPLHSAWPNPVRSLACSRSPLPKTWRPRQEKICMSSPKARGSLHRREAAARKRKGSPGWVSSLERSLPFIRYWKQTEKRELKQTFSSLLKGCMWTKIKTAVLLASCGLSFLQRWEPTAIVRKCTLNFFVSVRTHAHRCS